MKNLTQKDLQQLKSHGLSPEKVRQQLETFDAGIPFVELVSPATSESGIRKLSKTEIKNFAEQYDAQNWEVVKFVPASGAATRMFKDLQGFLNYLQGFQNDLQGFQNLVGLIEETVNKPEHKPVREFFDHLSDFPFYKTLLSETKKQYPDFGSFSETEKKFSLLKTLLDKNKSNFSDLPKGLVPFHNYKTEIRTAFEEHFFEAEAYSIKNNFGRLHFTVAENHLEKFQQEWKNIRRKLGTNTRFDVSYSFQEKGTDTIAVDMQNHPFRDEEGNMVFRPGGHGALLENLNQIDADIVFIKNIDNVSTEKNLPVIAEYKKALAGVLLKLQEEAFQILTDLQGFAEGNLVGLNDKKEDRRENKPIPKSRDQKKDLAGLAKTFLKEKLNIPNPPENINEIKKLLDRPIRICGMVKNTGAPGGGPFWVKNDRDETSLQIVETAQIDMENPQQKEILEEATHFNPVDLVCGVKNYKGEKFDLQKFSNPKRGFITQKSMNGRDLKALELPGLWNGAMEDWNTVFVEVPLKTFNPVKTVMDLLKPGHR